MADDKTEENVHNVQVKPSLVMMAIDTHPSMFVNTKKQDGTEASLFQDCLRACVQVTDALILSKATDSWSSFAVLLAGDETTTLVDFQDNILDSVKLLDDKKSLSNEKLADDYQRKGTMDLGMFFLACKKKFKQIGNDFYKRTVIFITNDDEPTSGDVDQKFRALNEVRNFASDQIGFEMIATKTTFDYSLFYNELFSLLKSETCENLIKDSDGLADKLTRDISIKFTQHKVAFYPFRYNLRPFLKRVRNTQTNKAQLFNNAHVSTDGSDLVHTSKRLTNPTEAVNHGELFEVNANEELAKCLYQIWQYCVDSKKALICSRKSRTLDEISFVQLIPTFVNNAKMFLMKKIPWIDELRPPARMPPHVQFENEANKRQIVNDILDQLTQHYDPEMFASPAYVRNKKFLRAKLMLGKPEESFADPTPDTDAVDTTLGSAGDRFENLSNRETGGTKRKAPRKAGGGSRKKPK